MLLCHPGITHYSNISPMGDVPLMAAFIALDAYLIKKVFGSFLFPWDFE